MRDYGKVYTAFWSSEGVRSMTDDGRMMALYLMTCPHGNMLGCFRLPVAYVSEDLSWPGERVLKGFDELFRIGFSYHCKKSSWLFIRKHLEWNRLENPNVGKAAAKLFDSLPIVGDVRAMLMNAIRLHGHYFPEEALKRFDTLSIGFQDPFETLSKPVAVTVAVEVPVTKQEPTPTPPTADAAGIVLERRSEVVDVIQGEAPAAIVVKAASAPRTDYGADVRDVFAYWQQKRGHDRAKLDDKRAKAIKARLKDGYTVGDLCRAVDGIAKSAHHMGQNDTRTVHDDIELICRTAANVDKFVKLAGPASSGMSPGLRAQVDILQEWAGRE